MKRESHCVFEGRIGKREGLVFSVKVLFCREKEREEEDDGLHEWADICLFL